MQQKHFTQQAELTEDNCNHNTEIRYSNYSMLRWLGM